MHERSDPANFLRIGKDVRLGRDVSVHCFVNLYGCSIGDESRVGAFVEIQDPWDAENLLRAQLRSVVAV